YANGGDILQVRPIFKSFQVRLPGPLDFIKENRVRISKVIRKNALSPVNADDRSYWVKALNDMGIINAPALGRETKIRAEFSYQPSSEELDQIIQEWQENCDSKWVNVGFELQGENEIKWLSHSLVKTKIEFDLEKSSEGIVYARSLLGQVEEYKPVLMRLVNS